jgi:hypothetical protein
LQNTLECQNISYCYGAQVHTAEQNFLKQQTHDTANQAGEGAQERKVAAAEQLQAVAAVVVEALEEGHVATSCLAT